MTYWPEIYLMLWIWEHVTYLDIWMPMCIFRKSICSYMQFVCWDISVWTQKRRRRRRWKETTITIAIWLSQLKTNTETNKNPQYYQINHINQIHHLGTTFLFMSYHWHFLVFFNGQILNFRLDYCLLLSAICLSAGDAVICSQILNLHGNAQQP